MWKENKQDDDGRTGGAEDMTWRIILLVINAIVFFGNLFILSKVRLINIICLLYSIFMVMEYMYVEV